MSVSPKPSGPLKWNVLDVWSTVRWTVAAAALTYAGPPVLGWLESQGGWVAVIVVPAAVAIGKGLQRWIGDNKN